MTNILLAWNPLPFPQGTSYYAADLADTASLVRLLKQVSRYRAHLTPQGWRFLWTQYGQDGLLEINQQAGWIDGDNDRDILEQLISRSTIAGYDPLVQRVRGDFERIETQELYA